MSKTLNEQAQELEDALKHLWATILNCFRR